MASILSDYLPKINQRITDYHIILVFSIMLRATRWRDAIQRELGLFVCCIKTMSKRIL